MPARQRTSRSRPRTGASQNRSTGEWAVRGALAVGALIIAYNSIGSTLANVVVKADPAAAHTLAPSDGRFTAALASREFSASPDTDANAKTANLARRALLQDATAVDALSVLGLQAQLRSDEATSDRIFAYSVELSRRELQPQLWAIEYAVQRGDIEGALANYDSALRTSQRARDILFPALAGAVSEPLVRDPLLDLLVSDPVWGPTFLRYAASLAPDPESVVQLFRAGTARGLDIENDERAAVVQRLNARNLMDEAWGFYTTFRPGAERNRSRDPDFRLDTDRPAPFDWTVRSATGLSAAIIPRQDGGVLDFAAPPSTRATVVRQVQLLPPGDYRIEGRSSGIDQPDRSRPYWTLECRGAGELGRVDLPNSTEADGRFSGRFAVPADCPVQTLSLVVRSSDNIAGVSGQIEHVQLMQVKDAETD